MSLKAGGGTLGTMLSTLTYSGMMAACLGCNWKNRGVFWGWCCWPGAKLLERSRQGSALTSRAIFVPATACHLVANVRASEAHCRSGSRHWDSAASLAASPVAVMALYLAWWAFRLSMSNEYCSNGRYLTPFYQPCTAARLAPYGITLPFAGPPPDYSPTTSCPQAKNNARTTHAYLRTSCVHKYILMYVD